MQTVEHLRELFRYDDWANRRMIVAVKESGSDRCRQILAHLLTTEDEYLARLFGKDSTGFDFWPDLSVEECGELARTVAEKYEKLMRRFDEEGLDLWTRYRTSQGVPHENDFRDLTLKENDRIQVMIVDCRGIVRFVAPVAPDADDLEAAIDEILAAAEQAEHQRTQRR